MRRLLTRIGLSVLAYVLLLSVRLLADEPTVAIVAADGSGQYRAIQEAIDAARPPAGGPAVILIRKGLYNEKLFIRKSFVALIGEEMDSTQIVYPELRETWAKEHGGSDWGAGVVNIDSGTTDITFANLTVYNNYGEKNGVWNKHQFAIRGAGTRVILLHCTVRSDGGDAVSLWNTNDGMYYHADCTFEGWVDYVCPRGWCYITHSSFFGHNRPSASIWHDGSGDERQKFVVTRSYFDGVPGFPLGRNHLDGQFYLVDCRFSRHMADRPFYRPPSSPREWKWGDRHFFSGCRREGGDYSWFADNLAKAPGSPKAEEITARWTFDGRWDPESAMAGILPCAFLPTPRWDDENTAHTLVLRWLPGRGAISHKIFFGTTSAPEFQEEIRVTEYPVHNLAPGTTYYWRVDEVTPQGTIKGETWKFTTTK